MKSLYGILLCLLLMALTACEGALTEEQPAVETSNPVTAATSTPVPIRPVTTATPATPTPMPAGVAIDPASLYPESLEQMLFRADVVVRASLDSITATTETISADNTTTYRPIHDLSFTVHEYIKGSGANTIRVVVRPRQFGGVRYPEPLPWFATTEDAQRIADVWMVNRNASWDDRQALLYLIPDTKEWYSDSYDVPNVTPAPAAYAFPVWDSRDQPVWDYTIDTVRRVWLPANSATVPSDPDDIEFITDGEETPHPTISLEDFRARKNALDAMLRAGEGIEGYEGCIRSKLHWEQAVRENPDHPIFTETGTAGSGLASGAEVYRSTDDAADYHHYWLSGPDASLFQAKQYDDDTDPKNGYYDTLETARPLPAGTYSFHLNFQHYVDKPCNFMPTDPPWADWTVNVELPAGVLHELFFDPVTDGTTVEADATNGVLEPATFAGTTIQRIAWEPPATVKMEVTPHTSIADHILDFIAFDGSVPLSLDVSDATTDATNNTLSWTVESQPWQDGDKLMLRIYLPAPSESPADLTGP